VCRISTPDERASWFIDAVKAMSQKMVLITGGAGHLGVSLCEAFQKKGFLVRVLVLPQDKRVSLLDPTIEVFYGDIQNPSEIEAAFKNVDLICHLAAVLISKDKEVFDKVNHKGTQNVVDLAKKYHLKKFIYVSSISVTYPSLTPYGKSKLLAEQVVQNSKIPYTILRPTLVKNGVEYLAFQTYVLKTPILFLPLKGRAIKRPVLASDLAQGIVEASVSYNTLNKTYALAGAKPYTLAEMAQNILIDFKRKKKIVLFPLFLCRLLVFFQLVFKKMKLKPEQALAGFIFDANPSIEKAQKDFNYMPKSIF
jgi:NADH dehydrogenase